MEWQPIETAPKDDGPLLVHEDDVTFMAFWGDLDAYKGEAVGRMGWLLSYHPEWPVNPEFWMPLPSPPDLDRKD